jgi:hypothetical protein
MICGAEAIFEHFIASFLSNNYMNSANKNKNFTNQKLGQRLAASVSFTSQHNRLFIHSTK